MPWTASLLLILAQEAVPAGYPILPTILSVLSLFGVFATGGVLIYRARADKRNVETGSRRNEVDATKVLAEATVVILNPLRDENERLRTRLEAYEVKLEHAEAKIEVLEAEVKRLGGTIPTARSS